MTNSGIQITRSFINNVTLIWNLSDPLAAMSLSRTVLYALNLGLGIWILPCVCMCGVHVVQWWCGNRLAVGACVPYCIRKKGSECYGFEI